MYELARGPFVWVAVIVFFAGIIYRAVELFRLRDQSTTVPSEYHSDSRCGLKTHTLNGGKVNSREHG